MKGVADSLLLVSEPFAVAYGMDALLHTMIIDIGAARLAALGITDAVTP